MLPFYEYALEPPRRTFGRSDRRRNGVGQGGRFRHEFRCMRGRGIASDYPMTIIDTSVWIAYLKCQGAASRGSI